MWLKCFICYAAQGARNAEREIVRVCSASLRVPRNPIDIKMVMCGKEYIFVK